MDKTLALGVVLSLSDKLSGPLSGAIGKARAMTAAGDKLQDRLKELNKQQQQLSAFKKLDVAMTAKARAMDEAKKKVEALRQAMAAMESPSAKQTKALERAEGAALKLAQQHNALRMRYLEQRPAMERLGITTGNLSGAEDTLRGKIAATNAELNRRNSILQKSERLKAAGTQAAQVGTVLTAGGLAGRAALTPALSAFVEQEDAATSLKAAMMRSDGSVSANFEKINTLAEKLGNRLPGTTAQLQGMMTSLIEQGMSEQAILGGLAEASANLGVVLGMPYKDAAEFAAKLQDATGTAENKMMGLMDAIQRAKYLGVKSDDMQQGIIGASPAFDVLKVKGLEAVQAFAPMLIMLDQTGMKGEAAGNALRKVFVAAMDADGKVEKAMKYAHSKGYKKLKLDFTNGKGEFGGVDKFYSELKKLDKLNTQTRLGVLEGIFGEDKETLVTLNKLIDGGKAGYDEVNAKIAVQGDIQSRVNAQLGTTKNLWDTVTGTLTNLEGKFTKSIEGEIKGVIDKLAELQEWVGKWMEEHPGVVRGLALIAFGAAALATVLGGLLITLAAIVSPIGLIVLKLWALKSSFALIKTAAGAFGPALAKTFGLLKTAATALWPVLSGGFMKVVGALRVLATALLTNPIFWMVAAVAGLAYLIYRNWDWLSTKFGDIWTKIVQFCSSGWAGLTAWWNGVAASLKDIGAHFVDGIIEGVRGRWETLKATLAELAASLPDPVRTVLGIHSPSLVFAEIGQHIMGGVIQGVNAAAPEALAAVQQVGQRLPAEIPEVNVAQRISQMVETSAIRVPADVAGWKITPGVTRKISDDPRIGAARDAAERLPDADAQGWKITPGVTRPLRQESRGGGSQTAATAAGAQSVVINVYASPGMDEKALADVVAAKLREHERGRASNARASLHDGV